MSNTPPSIAAVTISPSAPLAADTLTCSYSGFSDIDGEADASAFRWDVDGVEVGSESSLTGAFTRGAVVGWQ